MTDPTLPGPECGTASRPIERRGIQGQCDGCYGWHPMIITVPGWRIKRHEPSPAMGTECPGEGCSTTYDPPVYSRWAAPLCGDCLNAMPDGYDDLGWAYRNTDGTPEYDQEA